MTQQEVLDHLRKHHREWFTVQEIARHFDKCTGAINANLNKLYEDGLVERKLKRGRRNGSSWFWRIR